MGFRFYRRIFSGNSGNLLVSWGLIILLMAVFRFVAGLFKWIFRMIFRALGWLWNFILSEKLQKTARKDYATLQHDSEFEFMKFNPVTLPPEVASLTVRVGTIHKPDHSQVLAGEDICDMRFGTNRSGSIPAIGSGKIRWYVREGDTLRDGDFVYVLHKQKT